MTIKLSADAICAIRRDYARGVLQRAIGHRYGVSQTAVSLVVRRKRWANVECDQSGKGRYAA
jgi:hypothetical protein